MNSEEQALNIQKILDRGPMAVAKAYQDIVNKIRGGEILTPAEVKSFSLLEKKLQSSKNEETSIVDSMDKVARHFGKSLRQVQRWAQKGMPVLSGGRYDIKQIEAWRRLKKGGRGPAAGNDPRSQGQPDLVAEGDKDFWDMRSKKAQALQREIDLRKCRGEMVDLAEVEQLFAGRAAVYKQSILGLEPFILALLPDEERRAKAGEVRRRLWDAVVNITRPLPEKFSAGFGKPMNE